MAKGGNFGAFTTLRPASAMTSLGCHDTIIGHCEERNDKNELLSLGEIRIASWSIRFSMKRSNVRRSET